MAMTVVIVLLLSIYVFRKVKLNNAAKKLPLLLSGLSFVGQKGLPEPILNNNPGALEKSFVPWHGQIASDNEMRKFSKYVWGVRAMIGDLRQKIKKHKTLKKVISSNLTSFPDSPLNPEQYTESIVSGFSGLTGDTDLVADKETLKMLVQRFASVINGPAPSASKGLSGEWITDGMFDAAYKLEHA